MGVIGAVLLAAVLRAFTAVLSLSETVTTAQHLTLERALLRRPLDVPSLVEGGRVLTLDEMNAQSDLFYYSNRSLFEDLVTAIPRSQDATPQPTESETSSILTTPTYRTNFKTRKNSEFPFFVRATRRRGGGIGDLSIFDIVTWRPILAVATKAESTSSARSTQNVPILDLVMSESGGHHDRYSPSPIVIDIDREHNGASESSEVDLSTASTFVGKSKRKPKNRPGITTSTSSGEPLFRALHRPSTVWRKDVDRRTSSQSTAVQPGGEAGTATTSTTVQPRDDNSATPQSTTVQSGVKDEAAGKDVTVTPTDNNGTSSKSITDHPKDNSSASSESTTVLQKDDGTTTKSVSANTKDYTGDTTKFTTVQPGGKSGTTAKNVTVSPSDKDRTSSKSVTDHPKDNDDTSSKSITDNPKDNVNTSSNSITDRPKDNDSTSSKSTTGTAQRRRDASASPKSKTARSKDGS